MDNVQSFLITPKMNNGKTITATRKAGTIDDIMG